MPTHVYRVEHRETHEGPYNAWRADATVYTMAYAHCDAEAHPGPMDDEKLDAFAITTDHVFGFESPRALLAWFEGYLDLLDYKGYVLATYAVPHCSILFGAKQLCFERSSAVLVGHSSLALAPHRFTARPTYA